MSETITHNGKTYRLGDAPSVPLYLGTVARYVNPKEWEERPDPFGTGRDYCRTYFHKHGLRLILTATLEADHKRWLHISVSHRGGRYPTWEELCRIKDTFCGEDATTYQIHPPRSKHVSIHDKCLHLWTCLDGPVTPDFTRGGETI